MKRLLLLVGLAVAFVAGYAGGAKAIGVPGLAEYEGYFHGHIEYSGTFVMPGGIPRTINTATEFINFIENKLNRGTTQERHGAAFIIQTMIGTSRRLPPTGAQIADWKSRVYYAYSKGAIDWSQTYSYGINSYYQDARHDDAFYSESGSESAILFFNSAHTRVLYAIKHRCANPVGRVDPLEEPVSYRVTGRSTVSASTASPGEQVTFRHYLHNSGPNTVNVDFTIKDPIPVPDRNVANGRINSLGARVERQAQSEVLTIPFGTAPGTRYCRYIYWEPETPTDGSGYAPSACVTVVGDFEMQPSVTANASTAEQGDSITFTYSAYNEGPTAASPLVCKATANIRAPGWTPLPQQDADRNSDPGQTAPTINCPTSLAARATHQQTETITVGNLAPGSRICRSLVVTPRDQGGGPRASAESCVVIAKVPYVHFMGNDVWAGGGFGGPTDPCDNRAKIQTTAQTLTDGSTAGSVSEYGAFALDKIINFGSASKALTDTGAAGKLLTFSNLPPRVGEFGAPRHCINDYIAQYASSATALAPGSYDVGAMASGVRHIAGSAQFRGTMNAGVTQVYIVDGDVTINGDLNYPATYGSVSNIPSLILLVRGSITVQSGVRQMNGMFVAKGNFNTCDPPPGSLSVSICNNQLVINGPVITTQLNLLRTFGAAGSTPAQRKQPAEIFNFSTEFYLRNGLTGSSGVIRVVDQKDLPPRF